MCRWTTITIGAATSVGILLTFPAAYSHFVAAGSGLAGWQLKTLVFAALQLVSHRLRVTYPPLPSACCYLLSHLWVVLSGHPHCVTYFVARYLVTHNNPAATTLVSLQKPTTLGLNCVDNTPRQVGLVFTAIGVIVLLPVLSYQLLHQLISWVTPMSSSSAVQYILIFWLKNVRCATCSCGVRHRLAL